MSMNNEIQTNCNQGPDSDKNAFSNFLIELKQAFKPHGYLLSAAVSPSKIIIDSGKLVGFFIFVLVCSSRIM